jgi:hypothetical protein
VWFNETVIITVLKSVGKKITILKSVGKKRLVKAEDLYVSCVYKDI